MTHDELLAEIDIQLFHLPSYFKEGDKTIAGIKALRAVVELHEPYGSEGNEFMCEHCGKDGWPCKTVKAIEKELA